jgi:hypothetical protein
MRLEASRYNAKGQRDITNIYSISCLLERRYFVAQIFLTDESHRRTVMITATNKPPRNHEFYVGHMSDSWRFPQPFFATEALEKHAYISTKLRRVPRTSWLSRKNIPGQRIQKI